MSLAGFDLAFSTAESIHAGGVTLGLPSAAALAFLKMRAWLDRPAERAKDLRDLAHLMAAYVADDDERRWGERVPDDLAFEEMASFFLGVDVGALLRPAHRPHLEAFVSTVTPAALAARGPWVVAPADEAERALVAFRRGAR